MSFTNLLALIFLVGFATAPIAVAQDYAQEFVDAHNAPRAEVGVGPVSWNKTLADYALKYAETKKATCEMEHSMGPYGECLAMGYEDMTPTNAVKFWVTEKEFYDHKSNKCVKDECRHYTQVVWGDTTQIGCARVKCGQNAIYVICNYFPPGNYEGQSPY